MKRLFSFINPNSIIRKSICSSNLSISRGQISHTNPVFYHHQHQFYNRKLLCTQFKRSFCRSATLCSNSSDKNLVAAALKKPEEEQELIIEKMAQNNHSTQSDLDHYKLPLDQPVVPLDCDVAFDGLNPKEKSYAHFLSLASWAGGLIVHTQTSPESPAIFSILYDMFKTSGIEGLKAIALENSQFTEDDWKAFIVYTCGLFAYSGNYKDFGDTKIIPGISKEKFDSLVKNAVFKEITKENALTKWEAVKDRIYSLTERNKQLGLGEKGISTYFSDNCTHDDAELINRFTKSIKSESYITRVFKTEVGGVNHYEIRSASAVEEVEDTKVYDFENSKITLTRGDYSPLMELVCRYLQKAKEFCANETEEHMLDSYIKSFLQGSLDAHKQGSRFWIKNISPAIETYIGFIETYRDPAGTRGEFESFVSIVNRPMSQKFTALVDNAKSFLPLLPWPKEFERETFIKPDFTSLDVLTFAGSGVPAGINIPNYDEIRQNEGFKNVSLGNVINASSKDTKIQFLSEEDKELFKNYKTKAFEVQVGLHELLGHGSGKLLKKEKGEPNYSPDLINPLTNSLIETIYEEGETYDSVFTTLGSAYEECRAECVGIALSLESEVLKIFGFEGEEAETVKYVNWLLMIFAGAAKSLETYQPKASTWMQAHSQARFVILQVLIEAGEGLVTIEEKLGEDGKPDLLLSLDKSKIDTVGRKAINDFLLKLQIYKSTADIKSAREMFNHYSKVDNEGKHPWAKWRDIIMAKKQPRRMLVQSNTFRGNDGNITHKSYEGSHEGLIQSWIDRFQNENIHAGLDYCWKKDRPYFPPSS